MPTILNGSKIPSAISTVRPGSFEEELAEQPRVITLACHPHQCAVPYRHPHYARVIDMLLERDDVKFMTGSEFADW